MSQQQFIDTFVAVFLANDIAKQYRGIFAFGRHRTSPNILVEDAHFFALKAWERYQQFLLRKAPLTNLPKQFPAEPPAEPPAKSSADTLGEPPHDPN